MKVDYARWLEAQNYERSCWMDGDGSDMASDRNIDHLQRFNCYKALDSYAFPRAIEIGCGPFTNMRFVEQVCARIDEVHLLDPLIETYVEHKWCRYADRKDVWRHGCQVELFEWPDKFDLVVMVNVLAHCMDSEAVFAKVLDIMAPRGCLVLHEYTRLEQLDDVGHPLLGVGERAIEDFVADNFVCVLADKHEGLCGQSGRSDYYFIGQRRAT